MQKNGKFRCVPSEENFKTFRKKIKNIVNNSNYGSEIKTTKLAPIVRGWRNYHRYCKMDGSRFSLWFLKNRTRQVFCKEKKLTLQLAIELVDQAFPSVPYSENKHVIIKGNKSIFDGDIIYWSKRNSKEYDGITAKLLIKQKHTCGCCGMNFTHDEKIHLHHIDENHNNWKLQNLVVIHQSCHQYIHMKQSKG